MAFDRHEIERLAKAPDYFARHDAKTMNGREWEALKAWQKQQRETFFIEGKQAFRDTRNAVFREVREEFRGQWKAYYAAKRGVHDRTTLAEMKIALTAAQNRALDERREAACEALRKQRDQAYEAVKEQQRFDRAELGRRQAQGLRTYAMMDAIYPAPDPAPSRHSEPTSVPTKKIPWKVRDGGTAEAATTDNQFARSNQVVIDPLGLAGSSADRKPGVVHRGNPPTTPAATTDGFGRVVKELDRKEPHRAAEAQRSEPIRKEEPPRPAGKEMTKAAVEKARIAKAREMTDQKAENDQKRKADALRASWNQHRRWRGGRD